MLSCWKYWCILLLLLAGCMFTERSEILPDSLAPIERLPMQVDEYAYLAWLNDHQLVTQYNPTGLTGAYRLRIGLISLDAEPVPVLELPPHPQCADKLYSLRIPVAVADGQLAYVCSCSETQFGQDFDYPMLYDPHTDTARPVRADKFDPIIVTGAVGKINAYSFFPDMQTGILVDSWSGATQLHTFDATSVTQVDLGVDVVGTAALSPDGSMLLITTQQGKKGIGMLDEPYQIELVDPPTWKRRPLFSGYNAASITWSPDSQHVAIGTNTANGEPYDVWVINAATGVRRRIAHGFYADIAWSPDGTTIAAMRYVKPEAVMNTQTELVLLDLTQVELP